MMHSVIPNGARNLTIGAWVTQITMRDAGALERSFSRNCGIRMTLGRAQMIVVAIVLPNVPRRLRGQKFYR